MSQKLLPRIYMLDIFSCEWHTGENGRIFCGRHLLELKTEMTICDSPVKCAIYQTETKGKTRITFPRLIWPKIDDGFKVLKYLNKA